MVSKSSTKGKKRTTPKKRAAVFAKKKTEKRMKKFFFPAKGERKRVLIEAENIQKAYEAYNNL